MTSVRASSSSAAVQSAHSLAHRGGFIYDMTAWHWGGKVGGWLSQNPAAAHIRARAPAGLTRKKLYTRLFDWWAAILQQIVEIFVLPENGSGNRQPIFCHSAAFAVGCAKLTTSLTLTQFFLHYNQQLDCGFVHIDLLISNNGFLVKVKQFYWKYSTGNSTLLFVDKTNTWLK